MSYRPNGGKEVIQMNFIKMKQILKNAIIAYEFELEQQDYNSEEDMHKVLLNEFQMNEEEYKEVMHS